MGVAGGYAVRSARRQMAKKKTKGGQLRSAPQHPRLEHLLRTGEDALYGQVCWSIANRGTEPPRKGDATTLEGEDATKGRTRLVRPSAPRIDVPMIRAVVNQIPNCLIARTGMPLQVVRAIIPLFHESQRCSGPPLNVIAVTSSSNTLRATGILHRETRSTSRKMFATMKLTTVSGRAQSRNLLDTKLRR